MIKMSALLFVACPMFLMKSKAKMHPVSFDVETSSGHGTLLAIGYWLMMMIADEEVDHDFCWNSGERERVGVGVGHQ